MHVLHLAWEYPPRLFGGLGRHVEGLTGGLSAHGVQVTVITPQLEGQLEGQVEDRPTPGVRVLRAFRPPVPLPEDRWLADALDASVRMAERALHAGVTADVLHVHDWMAGHAARVLAPALGLGVITTIHATERGRHQGHLPPGYSAWIDAQEKTLVALADHVVVCAAHMRDHVVEGLDADADRVSVITGGVDVPAWAEGPVRTRTGLPRVVVAGRLEYEKGVQVLLAATADLPVEVVVAGRGSYGPTLRRTAHARAVFEGHLDRPALAALLRSAAAVVVPSLYEPFGLTALEAMAAGVPVIASDTGGLADIVTPGAGLRVEPGDERALAAAITRVVRDPELAGQLAEGGRRRAEELSWTAAAAAHLPVYESVRRW